MIPNTFIFFMSPTVFLWCEIAIYQFLNIVSLLSPSIYLSFSLTLFLSLSLSFSLPLSLSRLSVLLFFLLSLSLSLCLCHCKGKGNYSIDHKKEIHPHLIKQKKGIKCFKPRGRVSSFFHSRFSPLSNPCGGLQACRANFLTLRGKH